MPEQISKTQRWLDLIALLLNRRIPLEVDEIMERVPSYAERWLGGDRKARNSVRRMFERDKDELRAMGIPIDSVRYEINFGAESLEGYRIMRRDFYLPYLKIIGAAPEPGGGGGVDVIELERGEASLALEALAQIAELPTFPFEKEAHSARMKLAFDLGPELSARAPVLHLDPASGAPDRDELRRLADAILTRSVIGFRYRGIRRGVSSEREVEPYGLFLQREWYLVGRDRGRQAMRTFRVSRMEGIEVRTGRKEQPAFEIPAGFDLGALVGRRAWELSDDDPIMAEVLFRFPASLLVARAEEGELVREDPDGATVRRFRVTDPDPFLRWVLGFQGEALILDPADLAHGFQRLTRDVLARYGAHDE